MKEHCLWSASESAGVLSSMSLTRGSWHLKVKFFLKSTSSEDSAGDEHDPNNLFQMGLLDALLLEVSEGIGLSNIYIHESTNHNIFI